MFHNKYFIVLVFSFIFLLTFIIYLPVFYSYFFQDDWYSFIISRVFDFKDALSFFIPNKNVVYYRPLGMQIPFFLQYSLFGLNPVPFRLVVFFTHLFNSVLVYLLFKNILKSKAPSLLASFFYSTSGIHYIPFYWSATFAFVLGPTFTFLAFIFFLKKKYLISFLFFLIGLLTFEIIAVLPLILLAYSISHSEKNKFHNLLPYFLISAFYSIFRFRFLPPPDIPDYRISFNPEILLNLKYYFLWIFNWPEEMKNQFIHFFRVNPQFINDFRSYYLIFVITLTINIFFLIILPCILFILGKIKIKYRLLFFSFVWSSAGLLPVIFFPQHAFPYYLPLTFLGLMFFFISIFHQTQIFLSTKYSLITRLIQGALVLNWLISVFVLMDFNSKVHWAPRRSRISRNLVNSAHSKYIKSTEEGIFLVKSDSENRLALNDQDALRIFFNNPLVKTVYSDENIPGIRL